MSSNHIPTWIKVLAVVLTLFGIGAGIALYVAPTALVAGLDMSSVPARAAADMAGGRSLAQALLLALAALSGRSSSLRLAFIMRAATEGSDLIENFRRGAAIGDTVFVAVVIALEIAAIVSLSKAANTETAPSTRAHGVARAT